jgi:acyl-coenzyme A synthetase/AMP-(fatty) acid ligase
MPPLVTDVRTESSEPELALSPGIPAASRPLIRAGANTALTLGELLERASALAEVLPAGTAALNVCEHLENFLVGFMALLMRGQVCLLPPSRASAVLAEVIQEHPGSYRLDDSVVGRSREAARPVQSGMPAIPADRVVVVGYTSGSTGRPRANPKTWGSFVASTRFNAERVRDVVGMEQDGVLPWTLPTVPPQHMYGMEMSVLMPLLAGTGVHGGHPFYPADIARALEELPVPRVLVTTPVHLRALLQSGIELPALSAVISAAAPLMRETAEAVERRYGTKLIEFFGSTETCVIASRRTALSSAWRPYPGVTVRPEAEGTRVDAPWFSNEVVLQDVLEAQDDGNFVVRGRNADMVEVGGKRASLADLTRRLLAVPGVSDAVVFQPDAVSGKPVQRLAALVVAEGLTEEKVLAALATAMDPVFLPRPLLLVSRLPRNEVGKLPRDQLLAALKR